MDKDVEHGWVLTPAIESIRHIKDTGALPLGVAKKLTINKKGGLYTNICVTHDLSFSGHNACK